MTISLSVGSGKGGVGKSMLAANLAIFLAKAGRRVCLADLDLGGADIHILFGMFAPARSLGDFLRDDRINIEDILLRVPGFHDLRILPGVTDTLQSVNMAFSEKQRLLKALTTIDTDVLLLDIGAGVGLHTLDFFMMSELQVCVTTPEPTAIMDFYTFLQLATLRRAMNAFPNQHPVHNALREHSFSSLAEVFTLAESMQEGAKADIETALHFFNPLLVVNMVGAGAYVNLLKLRQLSKNYIGIYLPVLGEIPSDPAVQEAVCSFTPVAETAPHSPAGQALASIAEKTGKVIDLCLRKRQVAA